MGTKSWWTWWRRGRRAALVVSAAWCVVLGVGVTGALVAQGSLGRVGTVTLLGAVGMLVLPGLTALALRVDSRERRRGIMIDEEPAVMVHHAARSEAAQRREPPAHRVRATPGRTAGERANDRVGDVGSGV